VTQERDSLEAKLKKNGLLDWFMVGPGSRENAADSKSNTKRLKIDKVENAVENKENVLQKIIRRSSAIFGGVKLCGAA